MEAWFSASLKTAQEESPASAWGACDDERCCARPSVHCARLDDGRVRREARGEEQALLGALQVRQRALQLSVCQRVAGDERRRTRAAAQLCRGARAGCAHGRVGGEAQVVVG